jgi:hypothetical protein
LNSATVSFANGQSATFHHLNNSQLADLANLDGLSDEAAMSGLVEMGLMVSFTDMLRQAGVILDFAANDVRPQIISMQSKNLLLAN